MTQAHSVQNNSMMLITTVTMDRQPFFADPVNAREAIDCLYRVKKMYPFFLYAFVIMPDHHHFLMMVPPPEQISSIMRSYKSGLTFDTGIRKLWQPRFDCRLVQHPATAIDYIHMNPVKKGYVETSMEYPWSSACGRWDIDELG